MSSTNPSLSAGSSTLAAIDAELRDTLAMSLSILSQRRGIAVRLGATTETIDADIAAIRHRVSALGLEEIHV